MPHSMDYRLESEMTPIVEAWLDAQGLDHKAEFVTPWGICDLVGTKLLPERPANVMG